MPDSTLNTSSTDITETLVKPSLPTTKEAVSEKKGPYTSLESSIGMSVFKALRDGILTPEQAIEQSFPCPFTSIKDVSLEALKIEPLPTGFNILNDYAVLKKGRSELVVLGAGTSHGKSALLMQIAANVSMHGPVFVHSLEMDEKDIKSRLLAPRINIPLKKIKKGEVSLTKMKEADKEFAKMQLHLCTTGRKDIGYIQNTCYDQATRVGAPLLIVVDYLQLVQGPIKSARTYEIAHILGCLKSLAKEMKCPVLIGSQVNRTTQNRGKQSEMENGVGDYLPILADLKDSSSIEQDADVVVLLSRQHMYDRSRPNEADVLIAKNRGGELYSGVFEFSGEMCSFYERRGAFDT